MNVMNKAYKSKNMNMEFIIHIDFKKLRNTVGETVHHDEVENKDDKNINYLTDIELDVNVQDTLGKAPTLLDIEKWQDQCTQIIEILRNDNGHFDISYKYGKRVAQLVFGDVDYSDGYIIKLFLNIIHHECMKESQKTAGKLISLHCPLWKAVLLGNAEVIEYMIINGCPVDSYDPDVKITALSRACENMDFEIIKTLIKYGVNVDMMDCLGYLPIARYGSCGSSKFQQPEIIKILLKKSKKLKNLHQGIMGHQFQGIFENGTKEVIQIVLDYNENILTIEDIQGKTPLHYLSGNNHSDITEVLHGRNIDVNVRDAAGCTPLLTATQYPYSHVNTFQFLLEHGADVNARTLYDFQDVPLFSLCQNLSIEKQTYYKIIELFVQYNLDIQFIGLSQVTVFDIIEQNKLFDRSEPLLAHLAILDESMKPIHECIRNKIDSHNLFKSYFDVCKIELKKMKNIVIKENLTLYMIIVNSISDERILNSCKFDFDLLSKFEKLKNSFQPDNYYYNIVQRRIASIVSKLNLLQKATLIMSKLLKLGNNPHHIIVTEIMNYLDSSDMQTLTEILM